MWYWDQFPSGNQHSKKPLSKKQMEKLQENYKKWEMIASHVQELEEKNENKDKIAIEKALDSILL